MHLCADHGASILAFNYTIYSSNCAFFWAMFSASDICKEITNTGEILRKRGATKGAETMAEGMAKNMCTKLLKLNALIFLASTKMH